MGLRSWCIAFCVCTVMVAPPCSGWLASASAQEQFNIGFILGIEHILMVLPKKYPELHALLMKCIRDPDSVTDEMISTTLIPAYAQMLADLGGRVPDVTAQYGTGRISGAPPTEQDVKDMSAWIQDLVAKSQNLPLETAVVFVAKHMGLAFGFQQRDMEALLKLALATPRMQQVAGVLARAGSIENVDAGELISTLMGDSVAPSNTRKLPIMALSAVGVCAAAFWLSVVLCVFTYFQVVCKPKVQKPQQRSEAQGAAATAVAVKDGADGATNGIGRPKKRRGPAPLQTVRSRSVQYLEL